MPQAPCPLDRRGFGRGSRPTERKVDRDEGCFLAVEELDEPMQICARLFDLRAESSTQRKIGFESIVKGAHRARPVVGHGSVTLRNAPKSTFE
jgi:hypothetical protein